ncbi:hypothetical protein V8C86DRAFT_2456866 [Haematococcus lacustris]
MCRRQHVATVCFMLFIACPLQMPATQPTLLTAMLPLLPLPPQQLRQQLQLPSALLPQLLLQRQLPCKLPHLLALKPQPASLAMLRTGEGPPADVSSLEAFGSGVCYVLILRQSFIDDDD